MLYLSNYFIIAIAILYRLYRKIELLFRGIAESHLWSLDEINSALFTLFLALKIVCFPLYSIVEN